MIEPNQTVGPPTEKTLKNIRLARTTIWYFYGYCVEWKFKTQGCLLPHGSRVVRFHMWPHWDSRITEFWNQGPVWWARLYWLTFGLSIAKSLPERRALNEGAQYRQDWYDHNREHEKRRQSDETRT